MIPGTAGITSFTAVTAVREKAVGQTQQPPVVGDARQTRTSPARHWTHFLFPRSQNSNSVVLYQLLFLDLLALLTSCLLPSLIFPAWSLPQPAMPIYAVLVTLFAFSEGLYKNAGMDALEELAILARSTVFAMALVLVAAWNDEQPVAALITLAASLGGISIWRQVSRRGWNEHFADPHNVLIVGAGQTARAIARGLQEDPVHPTTVVGFVDDQMPLSPQVLGRIGDLDWLARSQFIDEIILAVPNQRAVAREAAEVAFRNHLDIRAVPDLPAGYWPAAGVERIGGVPVIALHREQLPSAALLLKRLLDVIGSLMALLAIGPMMAVLALLIRLDSAGPVVYAAQRTGAKGRPFSCYKFRSMTSDAEQMKETLRGRNQREGPIFKLANDPRITGFGRFLRRYSLDELPQLWNVLRGEMSLVGPRPHPVEEVKRYELHHYRRLDMKPGMTGLWQITARNSPSFDLNIHLDLTYIENWTLVLDLRILLSTIRVLFAPEGI